MKRIALTFALACGIGLAAQAAHAAVVDLAPGAGAQAAHPAKPPPMLAPLRHEIVTPPRHLPELPEPDVFAMMLGGLVLIGYRASRGRSDIFKQLPRGTGRAAW